MRYYFTLLVLLSATGLFTLPLANATEYPLPPKNSRLIGENISYTIPDGKLSLEAIAAKFQIGLLGMLEANPDVDVFLPTAGSTLTIPQQMLLPNTLREGIIVNLAELRLYYYPKGQNKVVVYPIGIGQMDLNRDTPTMITSVIQRTRNPTWTPTANIRKNYLAQGITLPAVVPSGPDNPMGLFAIRLAAAGGIYLIHGTNADFGIGMRVSSGCIRLRLSDIEELFDSVPTGTRVQIINEPVKTSVEPDGQRYVEVHQPLSEQAGDNPQTMPITLSPTVKTFIAHAETNSSLLTEALKRRSGMPMVINSQPGDVVELNNP